jgi:hypothetical protein
MKGVEKVMLSFLKKNVGRVFKGMIVFIFIACIFVIVFPGLRASVMGWYKRFDDNIVYKPFGEKCPDGHNSYYNANANDPSGVPEWIKMTWDSTLGEYSAVPKGAAQATVTCHAPSGPNSKPNFPN